MTVCKELRLFLVVCIVAFAQQYRTLLLGTLINADPTQQVFLHMDEATVNYDAKRIAEGMVMYRDFFQFQGPFHYYLYALVFTLFGASYEVARLFTVATMAASAGCIAVLVYRLVPEPRAGLAAALAAGLLHGSAFVPTWSCTYPHWTAELLLLVGLVLLTGRRSESSAAAGGALIASSALCILSLGVPVLLTAGVVVFLLYGARRGLLHFAGAGAPIVLCLAYFGLVGGLDDFIYATLVWPFSSYGLGQSDLSGYASYIERTIGNHARLGVPWSWCGWVLAQLTAWGPKLAFVGGALAGGLALCLQLFGRIQSKRKGNGMLIALCSAAVCSPLVLGVSRNDMTHLAFVGSFGLLGVAAVFSLVPVDSVRRWGAVSLFSTCILFVLPNHLNMHRYTDPDMRSWREYIEAHPQTAAIRAHLDPARGLFDGGYFGAMRYFYVAPAVAPMTFIPHASQRRYYTDDQWTEIAQSLLQEQPSVLHIDPVRFELLSSFAPELRRRYVAVGGDLYVLSR